MKCGIIKDLLPSYIDELTCEDSNQEIEAHLKMCQSCRDYYQQICPTKEMLFTDNVDQVKDLQVIKSFKKLRKRLIGICLLIAIIVVALVIGTLGYMRADRNAFGHVPYEQLNIQDVVVTQEDVEVYYEYPDIYTGFSMLQHDFYLRVDGEQKNVLLIGGYVHGLENVRCIEDASLDAGARFFSDVVRPAEGAIYDLENLDAVYYTDFWNPEFISELFDETGTCAKDDAANEQIIQWLEQKGYLIWASEE